MHAITPPPIEPATPHERRPWTILVLLAVAQFMVILDITVVNVALPSIGRALDFAPANLQWVVTAYVLFTGGLLLLGGRAADLLGRRRVFLAGLLTFTAASLASGLAPSPEALIAARAVQGLGAALLSPAALSLVTTTYSGAQRTAALSIWGAIGGAGAAAGVLFGGMLTSWLSWEWVFFINVPIGLAAAALTMHLVPRPSAPSGRHRELDLTGALAVTAGLVTLVYAIDGASAAGSGSARTLALVALAATLLGAFAAIERSVRRPLVQPSTWRVRSLISSATMMLGATGILIGAFFLNSLYLQQVLGASALETGLAFLPLALAIGLSAHVSSHALQRAGARAVVLAGLALLAAGALLLALAPDRAHYLTDLLPGFLALGAGVGLVFPAVSITAMADVTHQDAGMASGLMQTSHEIGAALGVAIMSAIAAGTGAQATAAAGYENGFIATAAIAGILGLLALLTVPTTRPVATARASLKPSAAPPRHTRAPDAAGAPRGRGRRKISGEGEVSPDAITCPPVHARRAKCEPATGMERLMSHTSLRELAHRHGDGLEVTLLCDARSNAVSIDVLDKRERNGSRIPVAARLALDAFHHPHAYAR